LKFSKEHLFEEVEITGFRPEILEKVFHLLHLLDSFRSHPLLEGQLVLKGGTALNLFTFNVPRLSVDIDLNYIGHTEREAMMDARPKFEEAVQAVCSREGFTVHRVPSEHAGGKWRLRYASALGGDANLEVDLNFLLRTPLWPIQITNSKQIGSHKATKIAVLDPHELAAGKLAALLARHASRDLFDTHQLLADKNLDSKKLRLAFIAYGAMNRKDWRTVAARGIEIDYRELKTSLLPLLRTTDPFIKDDAKGWGKKLVEECKKRLAIVLPLKDFEKEFLDRLLDHGSIEPALLTSDKQMIERLRTHPGLQWKALNVREFKTKNRP